MAFGIIKFDILSGHCQFYLKLKLIVFYFVVGFEGPRILKCKKYKKSRLETLTTKCKETKRAFKMNSPVNIFKHIQTL